MKLILIIALTLTRTQAAETESEVDDGTIYQFTVNDAGGNPVDFGERYRDKVLVVVNTATGLAGGLTEPNIAQLAELHAQLGGDDFAVAAFPSNSFGGEPMTASEAQAHFSQTFNATFDVYELTEVNGRNESALYTFLKSTLSGEHGLSDIEYNYVKFVVDKQGMPAFRYPPYFAPSRLDEDVDFLMSDAFARYAEAKKADDEEEETGDVKSLIESAPDVAEKPEVDVAVDTPTDEGETETGEAGAETEATAETAGNGTVGANATQPLDSDGAWHLQPADDDEAPALVDSPVEEPTNATVPVEVDSGADTLNGTETRSLLEAAPEEPVPVAAQFNATEGPPPPAGNVSYVTTVEPVAGAVADEVMPGNATVVGDISLDMGMANSTDTEEITVDESAL